jgi:hypothetical protein
MVHCGEGTGWMDAAQERVGVESMRVGQTCRRGHSSDGGEGEEGKAFPLSTKIISEKKMTLNKEGKRSTQVWGWVHARVVWHVRVGVVAHVGLHKSRLLTIHAHAHGRLQGKGG